MSMVDFDKIDLIQPEQASSITGSPTADSRPLGPITGVDDRTTLYDPLWGYFTLGQSQRFNADAAGAYKSAAEFVIYGVFTRGAEDALSPTANEHDAFMNLIGKFTTLETLFQSAADATAPTDIADWYTQNDTRLIVLPEPLRDKDDQRIYAFPSSLSLTQTQVPYLVVYSATLIEAKPPPAKLSINDHYVDNAVVVISPPSPVISRHRLVAGNGEVIQVQNYKRMSVDLSSTLPNPSGGAERVPLESKQVIDSLRDGDMTVGVRYLSSSGSPVVTDIWEDLFIPSEPSAEVDTENETLTLRVVGTK